MNVNEVSNAAVSVVSKLFNEKGMSLNDIITAIDEGYPVDDLMKLDEEAKNAAISSLWNIYISAMKMGVISSACNEGFVSNEEVSPFISSLLDQVLIDTDILNAKLYGGNSDPDDVGCHLVKE